MSFLIKIVIKTIPRRNRRTYQFYIQYVIANI